MKNWINLHIYYHADQDRLIREAIFPLLANLYEEVAVRRFFFVRYELGGPHIRLRLESTSREMPSVRHSVKRELVKFLDAIPSLHHVDREKIEQVNNMLLATDESENDANIYGDNTIHEFPFKPEVQRYGGPEILPYSLDLFTFTTAESLGMIHDVASLPRAEIVTRSIRALIRASLALASRYEELAEIWRNHDRPASTEEASPQERTAKRRLEELAWAEISKNDATWQRWSAAGHSLRRAVASATEETQARILRSQVHMFANRLDIGNAVERGLGALMADIFQARSRDWRLPQAVTDPDSVAAACREAFARMKARVRNQIGSKSRPATAYNRKDHPMNSALTLAKYEVWRRLRNRAFVAGCAVLCAALILSLWLSGVRYRQQERESVAAVKGLKYTVAQLPENPMSIFSSDLNDILYSPYDVGFPVYSVRALTSDAGVNPFLRTYERPDPLFVLTVLGSLFALLVSCDVFSSEEESKRMSLLLASCPSRTVLLWGKVLGSFTAVLGPVLICWAASLLGTRLVSGAWASSASVTEVFGLVALYFLVHALVGAALSASSRTTVSSAVKAMCVWIITVLLLPVLGAAAAQRLYPIPSSQQVEADLARARTQNQNLANFEAAKIPPHDDAAFAALYGRYEGLTTTLIHDQETWYQRELQQELRRAIWIERISPASCLRLAAMRFTHTGFSDLVTYRLSMLSFKLDLARYVLRKRIENTKFGTDVPRFSLPHGEGERAWPELAILLFYGIVAYLLTRNRVLQLTSE